MKRNMDLIRQILFAMESQEHGFITEVIETVEVGFNPHPRVGGDWQD